jgi:hypothetical protein
MSIICVKQLLKDWSTKVDRLHAVYPGQRLSAKDLPLSIRRTF